MSNSLYWLIACTGWICLLVVAFVLRCGRSKQSKRKTRTVNKRPAHLKKIKTIETSKLLAVYLFILLNVIIIYALVAMWRFADLAYLGVLITDVAAQVLVYTIYCLKAFNAKKQEEFIKFKREQLEKSTVNDILSAASENREGVQLRSAYIDVTDPIEDVSII